MKKNCSRAFVRCPNGAGNLLPFAALTKQSSYEWGGETLLNKVYSALKKIWNMNEDYAPIVKINGVFSGCNVIGDGVDDNVQVGAGVLHLAGADITVAADTTVALTRPASAKKAIVAVIGDDDGVITTLKGTDGDAIDLTGGYGGAGQKPLVAVDKAVIRYVALHTDTPGPIPQEDIYLGDSANIPFEMDPARGLVILGEALALNHTGGVARGIYAQYYSQQDSMAKIGELKDAKLDITVDTVDTTILSCDWKDVDEALSSWKLTASKFKENQYFVQKLLTPGQRQFWLEIKEKSTDTFHYLGQALLTSGSITLKKGPMDEPLNFVGKGELVEVTE
jgi:hypothetical protein